MSSLVNQDPFAPHKAIAGDAALTHGLAVGTTVLTLDGALPVEYLAPGDRILTRSGLRRLVSVQAHRLKDHSMIRIAQDVLGQGRPAEVVHLVPNQPVLIRDWRAKALFGQPQALVPAIRLVDGDHIRPEVLADVRLYTLTLDGAAVIYAGGLELACDATTVPA